jgi:hypothetical protein
MGNYFITISANDLEQQFMLLGILTCGRWRGSFRWILQRYYGRLDEQIYQRW